MDKEDVVCVYIYNSAIKKSEIMPFAATWMQLEIIILSEVSQTERQILYDITYRWNLQYDTNETIYETESQATPVFWPGKSHGWRSLVSYCT